MISFILIFPISIFLVVSFIVVVVLPVVYLLYKIFKNRPSPKSKFFSKICLGHRGAKKNEFPFTENTMTAFHFCWNSGADGVELDVNFTKDHKLAVFHDIQSVKRVMTSRNKTRAKIRDLTLQELRDECSYLKGKKDHIPTLGEVVSQVNDYNKTRKFQIMIELKEWRIFESINMAFKISNLFQKYPFLYTHSVVGSFNPFILYILRWIDPKIVTNMLFWRDIFYHYLNTSYDWPDLVFFDEYKKKGRFRFLNILSPFVNFTYNFSMQTWMPSFLGAGVVGMSRAESIMDDSRMVKKFQKRGYGVNIWGINSKKEKLKFLKRGVSVTTDYVFD